MSDHTTVRAEVLDYEDPDLGVPRPMVSVSTVRDGRQFLSEVYSTSERDCHLIRVRVDPGSEWESALVVSCSKEQLDALILSLVRARAIAARAGVLP